MQKPDRSGPTPRLCCGAPGRGRCGFAASRVSSPDGCQGRHCKRRGQREPPIAPVRCWLATSRLGLDLACGCRSEGLLGMPGGSGKKPLPNHYPTQKMAPGPSWGLILRDPGQLCPPRRKFGQRGGRDQCMDSGGCLPAVFREHRVLRVVEKGPSPFFQERNPVKTSWIRDQIGVFSKGPL